MLDRRQVVRIALAGAGLFAVFGLLLGRLIFITTSLDSRLEARSEGQHSGTSVLEARRGTIFDSRGRVLACSRSLPDVFVDPGLVPDVDELAAVLGPVINESPEELAIRIRERAHTRYVVVAREVDEITARAVGELNVRAVGLTERPVRHYPLGESCGHVLGFVGREGMGLEGIELRYDEHLRGEPGRRRTVRDVRGRSLWRTGDGTVLPTDGGHVVLTIDAEVQRIVEEHLEKTVQEFEAESGVAIVMAAGGGDVLAMASFPGFDPNHPERAQPGARRNRAVTDPVEPGSAFKPIIASGALDGGFVKPDEKINCHKGLHYIGRRAIRDTKPSDELDLAGILARSSNIGMSIIAERMGQAALYSTIRRFGFGEETGIECLGEHPGLVRDLAQWSSLSTASVSFGYEVLVTPIQLIAAYATLLNNGERVRPRLVRELLSPDGETAWRSNREFVPSWAASESTARFMREVALPAVVEGGGGFRAGSEHYRVLGKTGTTKLTVPGAKGYTSAYLSTFVGAAPVGDPEVIVLVMIRRPNPERGYYGSSVSAPPAGRILEETLAYLGVPPSPDSKTARLATDHR